jgi:RPA family protein
MRPAAVHVPLVLLDSAEPVQDGEYTHFRLKNGAVVYRVHVWGVVMNKFVGDNYVILTIDDHSGTISVSFFEPFRGDVEHVEVGDTVDIVGRVRQRNDEISLVGDVLKIVGPKVEMLRRLENLLFATERFNDAFERSEPQASESEERKSEETEVEEMEIETLDLEGDEW